VTTEAGLCPRTNHPCQWREICVENREYWQEKTDTLASEQESVIGRFMAFSAKLFDLGETPQVKYGAIAAAEARGMEEILGLNCGSDEQCVVRGALEARVSPVEALIQ
jgi:hypothetical protein